MNPRHIFPVVYARSVDSTLPTSPSKADALRQAIRRGSPPPGPTRQRRLHVSRCPRTDLTVRLHRRVLLYPRPDGRPRRSDWIPERERDHDPRKRTTILRGGDRDPCGLRLARCALSADPAALRCVEHVWVRWIRRTVNRCRMRSEFRRMRRGPALRMRGAALGTSGGNATQLLTGARHAGSHFVWVCPGPRCDP